VTLETRKTIPAYTLRGYKLRWVVYADQDIPLETGEVLVPDLAPGKDFSVSKTVRTPGVEKIHVELVRPTGFSVIDKTITERPA
jgi:beta-glucuronidase